MSDGGEEEEATGRRRKEEVKELGARVMLLATNRIKYVNKLV